MTDLRLDTTKDAALRLCAEVVEERDEAVAILRQAFPGWKGVPKFCGHDFTCACLDERAAALLARLDGRTE